MMMTCFVGCGTVHREEKRTGWACEIEDRSISRFMGDAVNEMAMGDDEKWNELANIWYERRLDGIGATCYLVGLGELFARAPNVFLERHLSGDDVAKQLAREGYNLLYADEIWGRSFDPEVARDNAVSMFRQRKNVSNEQTSREIEVFIAWVTGDQTDLPAK